MKMYEHTCAKCGNVFEIDEYRQREREKLGTVDSYCSADCRNHRDRVPVEIRLGRKVEIRGIDECWPFHGASVPAGYGKLSVGRKASRKEYLPAHRVAWTATYGDIPDGLYVCHQCDNPPCCNPRHLFLGTHQDNMRDMISKGRAPHNSNPGEAHGRAKLTDDLVRYMRLHPEISPYLFAAQFGVCETAARNAQKGKTWKHLPM